MQLFEYAVWIPAKGDFDAEVHRDRSPVLIMANDSTHARTLALQEIEVENAGEALDLMIDVRPFLRG